MSVASERKLVTVLFCDLVGSTALGERLDPEAIQSVQRAYFGRMRTVIEQFGGTVEKFMGDAVVAVFGVPTLHEDDAERAVRCALEMHQALVGLSDTLRPRFGVELTFRTGVHTGEAVVSTGTDALATGDVMNTAARLEQQAAPGQIFVGQETVLLTADVVEYGDEIQVDAKGKADPVRARPALRLHARRKRERSPLVGRGRELELLAGALERAIAQGELQTVLVVGEPGIGKTRLAEEFSARARGRATVLRGACLPYGEGSTWRPFEEIVRKDAGIGDADDDAQVLGKLNAVLEARHAADETPLLIAQLAPLARVSKAAISSEQELRWALGRYLQAIASATPVVLMLDDLHWGDDTLLEAILELLRSLAAVPLVLLLQGRPELFERLTGLQRDDQTQVIRLGGLSPRESAVLVNNFAAAFGTRWTEDIRDALVERGDGSPLFLEEVAAMARDEGLSVGVPRSLRALIAARLDSLPLHAKRAAQVAAVVGDVFSEDNVAKLASPEQALPAIRQLESRGFVVEEPASSIRTQRQFSFRHTLIREVTYLSLAKIDRAELHRRTAAQLEPQTERRPEVVLAIAHHLEQALVLRREVFPAEAAESELAEATVEALRRGASWLGANAGVRESIEMLRRAISVAEGDWKLMQLARAQLAVMLARSGGSVESVEVAQEILAEPVAPEAAAFASLALAEEGRSRADAAAMTQAGARALELARSVGLPLVEIEALDIVGLAEAWAGRLTASIERRRRAIELALELGDLPRAAWAMAGYHAIALLGLGKVEDAERHAVDAMRLATESGSLRGLESVHAVLGFVRRAQDRLDEAVTHGRERFRLAEALGEPLWLFNSLTISLARPLIELGRLDEAWECLDRALAISPDPGAVFEGPARAQRVAVLLARGQLNEAAAEAELVDSEPYPETAELRTAQGLDTEADEIWQRLLELSATSEDLLERTETVVGYARFLAGCGRGEEARARLVEVDALIHGTGLTFHRRLIREAEALLT